MIQQSDLQAKSPADEFDIYPAIDVLGGRCVRLLKGDYDAKTEYGQDLRAVAERWLGMGATWLHVVDLDGAKSGSADNFDAIREVVKVAQNYGARVQVGGGIRTVEAILRWLDAGVTRCIVGTAALEPGWIENTVQSVDAANLIVGLDGRKGKMAVRGWLEQTDVPVVDVAQQFYAHGVRYALVTDVDKDGTLEGANVTLAREVQEKSDVRCIASGGVRNLTDVLAAKEAGLAGVIAGRSIYDGTLQLAEALVAARGTSTC